jgi:carboxypeptidase Q
MHFRRTFALSALIALLISLPLAADWPVTEKIDLDAIYRIKDEGLQRSKVMELESYLTDVYGPRLTGSPNIKEAADWAQKTMKEWGLANVHLERFPFGRGWQNQRFVAHALTPRAYPLIAYPKAWTPGTKGPVSGEAVMAIISTEKDFDTFRGKLRGKFVLATPMREVPAQFEAPGHRYTDAELADLAKQPAAGGRGRWTKAWRPCSTLAAATAARCSCRAAVRATRRTRRHPRRSSSPSNTTDESSARWKKTSP